MNSSSIEVLVVDDAQSQHISLEFLLKHYAINLHLYHDIAKLNMSILPHIDIGLIDMCLGDVQDAGIYVAQQLRELGLICPLIAMSGFPQDIFAKTDVFSDFINKPSHKDKLIGVLETYAGKLSPGQISIIKQEHQHHNMTQELSLALQLLKKGANLQKSDSVYKACAMLKDNSYLALVPSFKTMVDMLQEQAQDGYVNTFECISLHEFLTSSLKHLSQQHQPKDDNKLLT